MEENLEIPIKAEHRTVVFFDGLDVDGYRMPNGEFRVGLARANASKIVRTKEIQL